jgi:hypothetical protein
VSSQQESLQEREFTAGKPAASSKQQPTSSKQQPTSSKQQPTRIIVLTTDVPTNDENKNVMLQKIKRTLRLSIDLLKYGTICKTHFNKTTREHHSTYGECLHFLVLYVAISG